MYNTDKITTRMLFKNMDLISRRNWKSSKWLSQRNGTIKFWNKKGTTVFVYKPYKTTGYFKVYVNIVYWYIAFIQAYDQIT